MVEGSKDTMLEDSKEDEAVGEDLRAVIEEFHADCEEVLVVVNERDYSDSSDRGEYGDSDESAEEILRDIF
ncbi:hypothetical protein V6N13_024718 [Hibiscus sabdariffa]|uniref:Uncharacterized protein n=1 Tax=Hibiscus sabdariffa TaxID=183260 RepID=A0ABR2QGR9_9ROSI